jgi:integrase
MATHEIQNLVRRGNVFYWRPRVPRRFSKAGQGHLSLSLRQSDHMKARYMARRLNTLLHDLQLRPGAALTTKDQLEALFRTEVERMGEHLDNLQFAAKRTGSDPLLSLRADLEVGWAYRLIETFGTMRRLSFSEDCAGRAVLERAGIPAASIAVIVETFAQEQSACRQVHFENALRADMEAHGIPDTLLNRERATAELMRAKADMLLAASSRYPEAGGLGLGDLVADDFDTVPFDELPSAADEELTSTGEPIELQAVREDDAPDTVKSADSLTSVPDRPVDRVIKDEADILADGQKTVIEEMDASRAASEKSTPDAPAAAIATPAPHGRPMAILEFAERCEGLIKSKETWDKKTAQDVRVVVETFEGILREHGVRDTSEIEQYHLGKLRDHFDEIPPRYGQSARLRKLSPLELRQTAARMVSVAAERNEAPMKLGLGTNTIRKHLGNLAEFLRYLRGRGYAVRQLSLEGLRPPKLKPSDIRTLTDKPGPERLRPMFRLPVFTGCLDADNQHMPGDKIFHSANYYVPMLLTYLGARRNEITGLAANDVKETANGWAIDIRINQFRRVKNAQSLRMLPVPDEVLRLGFVPYVRAIRDLGYQALFPELFHPEKEVDHGDRFYDDFKPLAEASDELELWPRLLHALRHGHADTLFQLGVENRAIDDISGRSTKGETGTRYTNVAGLPLVKALLARYPKVTENLEPRPLTLLPWVADRQPAPWTFSTQSARLAHARVVRSDQAKSRRE